MSAIFKFLFERATDPLGLPINALYEYIILAVIDAIAYGIAYSKVGDMYHGGLISGRTEGSFFHWLIRFILFVGLWLLTYGAIQGYFFVTANWQIILMIAGSFAGAAMLCTLAVTAVRLFKKHRTVNGNA
ncbi:hypothetical protein [uncultured Ruminococcus sp.]|uniref:hypothetical protein n=1 Tax=uncultured Ruminococcus sp. TaxID=165186 RepID=UPI00266DC6DA|nr:hypothetical protein [uncultured Ruminococcus sp.]